MPAKIGPFFEIFINKYVLATQYPGGLDQFLADTANAVVYDDLIVFGTMGQDDTLVKAFRCLEDAHLNCDEDNRDCVYVCTEHYLLPKKQRDWLHIKQIAKHNIVLSVDPDYEYPKVH
jgi:hypothetical protein